MASIKPKTDALKLKSINKDNKEKRFSFFVAIAIPVLVILLSYNPLKILTVIDYKLYDSLVGQLPKSQPTGLVAVVDIDEKSLQQYGQWPWPRYKIAQLLQKLQQLQVASVGIDFVFAEADRTSLIHIQQSLQQHFNMDLSLENVPQRLHDNDIALSQVLSSGPFVLGYSFIFEPLSQTPTAQTSVQKIPNIIHFIPRYMEDAEEDKKIAYQADRVVNNIASFSGAAVSSGFFNVQPDQDGVIRKVPMLIEYQDRFYPALSLATLMMALDSQQLLLNISAAGIDSLQLDELTLPLDPQGNFLIHFQDDDEQRVNTISAIDIIDNKVTAEMLAGHIILIGSSAKGLHDLRSTPYDSVIPGVMIHAKIIDNILREDFISQPQWSKLYEALLIIMLALISAYSIIRFTAVISLLINVVFISSLLYAAFYGLQKGIYISVFYPLLSLLFNISILYVIQYRLKEKSLVLQTQELNKIQESAIKMLKHSNIELEENQHNLEQKITDSSRQLTTAFEKLDKFNKDLSDSIQYGAGIQRSLLPHNNELNSIFSDSFVIWEPRDRVGGDIYFSAQTADFYIVAVIDCTGHGVPGALLSMVAISALRKIVMFDHCYQPASILKQLNHSVKTTLGQDRDNAVSDDGLEISLCCIDLKNRQLHYAGAGLPLIVMQKDQLKLIKADRHKIGYKQSVRSDINYDFHEHCITLDLPIRCYLFTDGLVDQPGGERNLPFGKKRLQKYLQTNYHLDFKSQQRQLMELLVSYQGNQKRRDDITIMGFLID